MKCIVSFWIIVVLCLAGCKPTKTHMEEVAMGCDSCKASAILWIDKEKGKKLNEYASSLRTVKVYAEVYPDGTFRILDFCKQQSPRVERYIRRMSDAYTIRREILEENYISQGKQYLQIRYIPDKVK